MVPIATAPRNSKLPFRCREHSQSPIAKAFPKAIRCKLEANARERSSSKVGRNGGSGGRRDRMLVERNDTGRRKVYKEYKCKRYAPVRARTDTRGRRGKWRKSSKDTASAT